MRTQGAVGFKTLEFAQSYEKCLLNKKYKDPVQVLFQLMNSRKQAIQVQAASVLLSYRYPKHAVAKLEIERPGQIIMKWEETIDHPPVDPIDITPEHIVPGIEVVSDQDNA